MLNNRVLKNIKTRTGLSKSQVDYLAIKFIAKNLNLKDDVDSVSQKRLKIAYSLLQKYPVINSRTASKNLCVITGKARSVYRFCKLSRMELKRYSGLGLLNGLKPSS